MGNRNQFIEEQAAALESPIAFDGSVNSSATTRTNIDKVLDLLALEGADENQQRLFLDEMSPAARTSMYAILLAMKAATTDV